MAWDINNKNNWINATLKILLNEGDYFNRYGDYESIGLTDKAKVQIDTVKWYLGGIAYNETNTPEITYKLERGTATYGTNQVYWTGKVGLIYRSDGAFSTSVSACLEKEIEFFSDCNNWLPLSSRSRALGQTTNHGNMSPYIQTDNMSFSWWSGAPESGSIHPVIYLKINIMTTDGNGTKSNPYILTIE